MADADDGSFVVLDMSPDLIRRCLLFSGLDDTLVLSPPSLSASKPSFLDAPDDIMLTDVEIECRNRPLLG